MQKIKLILVVLSFLLASITARSQTEIKKIEPVFLLNYQSAKSEKCEGLPKSVCMNEEEYRKLRLEGKILEIKNAYECPKCESQSWTTLSAAGSGFALGLLLGLFIHR